jgi:hypothetical protein
MDFSSFERWMDVGMDRELGVRGMLIPCVSAGNGERKRKEELVY